MTGVIAVALLNILGVEPDHIVADYTVTAHRLKLRGVPLGVPDDTDAIQDVYRKLGGSPEEGVLAAIQLLREHQPLDAHLSADELQQIRSRFLGYPTQTAIERRRFKSLQPIQCRLECPTRCFCGDW